MREFDLRKLQLCELDMLKDVAKMCDENEITYFLDSGTLLGAVRHKGFIPWDDDIDIGMDTENYKKFCRIAPKKLGEKYFVQNYKTDRKVGISWTRVRINGTTSMERNLRGYDIHHGICMDVFEYRGIPTGIFKKIARLANDFKYLLLVKYYVKIKNEKISKKLKFLYTIVIEKIRINIIALLDKIARINTKEAEYCYNSWYSNFSNPHSVIIPSKFFEKSQCIKIQFEDDMFWAPREYEKILKLQYGDWENIPEEKDRGGHGDIIVDLHRDYKIFMG